MKRLMPTPMSTMPGRCPTGVFGRAATSCSSMPKVWLWPASVNALGAGLPALPARFASWVVQVESLMMDSRAMESPRS